LLALTDNASVNGEALRNWLVYGEPILIPGITIAIDEEGTEPPDITRGRLNNELIRHALALADAVHLHDKAGVRAAGDAIVRAVEDYRATLDQEADDG
jgi:hypothetical protein